MTGLSVCSRLAFLLVLWLHALEYLVVGIIGMYQVIPVILEVQGPLLEFSLLLAHTLIYLLLLHLQIILVPLLIEYGIQVLPLLLKDLHFIVINHGEAFLLSKTVPE